MFKYLHNIHKDIHRLDSNSMTKQTVKIPTYKGQYIFCKPYANLLKLTSLYMIQTKTKFQDCCYQLKYYPEHFV